MKILSNFDTKFRQKLVEKKKEQFQASEILIIRRSIYYFIFRVLFPFIVYVLIGIIPFILLEEYLGNNSIYVPLFIVWFLVVWFRVVHKLLKFLYDFTAVDPQGITTYKQKGILHSVLKQIPANRIRSIQFERNSILENIFEFGSIEIHTDFTENMHVGEDDESPSVIGLTYVDAPYKVKTQITDICFK